MRGLHYFGLTVSQVLTELDRRHVHVQSYRHTILHRHTADDQLLHSSQVPGSWRVLNAVAYASHQVILFVGPPQR